ANKKAFIIWKPSPCVTIPTMNASNEIIAPTKIIFLYLFLLPKYSITLLSLLNTYKVSVPKVLGVTMVVKFYLLVFFLGTFNTFFMYPANFITCFLYYCIALTIIIYYFHIFSILYS